MRGKFFARCKVGGKVSVKYFLPPIISKGKLKERSDLDSAKSLPLGYCRML